MVDCPAAWLAAHHMLWPLPLLLLRMVTIIAAATATGASRHCPPPPPASFRPALPLPLLLPAQVSYCQGMAFSAGVLLMYLLEEEAFRCMGRQGGGEGGAHGHRHTCFTLVTDTEAQPATQRHSQPHKATASCTGTGIVTQVTGIVTQVTGIVTQVTGIVRGSHA